MKRALQLPAMWLLVALLWLTGTQAVQASHIQGGQISYRYVGPGSGNTDRYSVTVTYFRDCSGISLPSTLTLEALRGGCNATTTVTATLTQSSTPQVGTPYCGRVQAQAICSAASPLPLYEYVDFTGTIDLAPAPEWTLGVEDNARPTTANLTTQSDFRFEAKLYSLIPPTSSGPGTVIRNNSPQYSSQDLPVPFVPVNQSTSISFAAAESEGDSLVYTLDTALQNCNNPNLYKVIPGTCAPAAPLPGCTFTCPANGPGRTYTPEMPIAVGYTTTACVGGSYTLTPQLAFSSETGLMTFTPNRFLNTAPVNGDNKYVVVCRIDEYRALTPGGPRNRLVGSVRRDFLVTVIAGNGNTAPNPPIAVIDTSTTVGGTATNTAQRTRIVVRTCNFNQARVVFTDPDNIVTPSNPVSANQLLTVTYTGATPLSQVLQGGDLGTAVLQGNGTTSPVLILTFQPSPQYINRVISLSYRIDDDNCPIKGTQTRVIEIEVVDGRAVRTQASVTSVGLSGSGLGGTSPVKICPGGAVNLSSRITAVDSVRQTILGRATTVAQTYDMIWYAAAGEGLPAASGTLIRTASTITSANTRNFGITVRPTVTTRYYLFSNPRTGGFPTDNRSLNVCGALDSVEVQVVPEPALTLAATDTLICAGASVTLTGTPSRQDNIADNYTYRWTGTGVETNTTNQVTVTPQVNTRYMLTVTGDPRFGCDVTKAVNVRVVPNATAKFDKDSVASTGSSSSRSIPPITYTFTNRSTLSGGVTPFAADTLRYTYQYVRDSRGVAITPARPEITFARGTAALSDVTLQLVEPGAYIIRLRAATTAGGQACAFSIAQTTVVVRDFQIPNIITPNGDNLNDFFLIKGNLLGSKLEIYNRWGRKVADYGNYQNNWNGEGQANGVYYYLLTEPNGVKTKGWIEIVRGE